MPFYLVSPPFCLCQVSKESDRAAQGKPLSVLKCERVKDTLCETAPDRVRCYAAMNRLVIHYCLCRADDDPLVFPRRPAQVLRHLFAQSEKHVGQDGSLPIVLCVDMLAYLQLYHMCEVIADAIEDILEDMPEQLRLLRKRDRINTLSLTAEARHRGARKEKLAQRSRSNFGSGH